ncbi:mrp [Tritrichomonas foetus]|uniref:Mrp n=1 Tax=Tritrichomonas foetus TaxID=1144522 RepID=A0A1J4K955_9EUKA|nr:mrp [Tritrichomonas foetus]|eukprot:OHT06206.1 mrp [Tritrichomonas foetus]
MLISYFKRFASSCSSAAKEATKELVKQSIPGVGRILLTSSCKGGVGKSTVALNTAISLSKTGAKVGLFDADIYGPSVPTITKTKDQFLVGDEDSNFLPVSAYGIETVSLGNAVEPEAALIWKGPLVSHVIQDFLLKSIWPPLDYLVIDTPPGTGDVHLDLSQLFNIDGTLLVTSPQQISVDDVARSVDEFNKMGIPILGIIQNFDGFVCEHCKTPTKIFPGNGAEKLSEMYNIPVLGSLPIDPSIAECGDEGVPAVIKKPDSEYAKAFEAIAETIVSLMPRVKPKIEARNIDELHKKKETEKDKK